MNRRCAWRFSESRDAIASSRNEVKSIMETYATVKSQLALLDRRAALRMTAVGLAATLVPGSANAAADTKGSNAAVVPLETEFAYEALVTILPSVEIGPTSRGTRRYIPITGGTFHGPKISGTVLLGGADWQLERPDGVTEIDALYSMKTDDGAVIVVRNRGLIVDRGAYFRTIPQFEAPRGRHDWLNKSVFVGSVAGAPQPGAVIVRIFRVV